MQLTIQSLLSIVSCCLGVGFFILLWWINMPRTYWRSVPADQPRAEDEGYAQEEMRQAKRQFHKKAIIAYIIFAVIVYLIALIWQPYQKVKAALYPSNTPTATITKIYTPTSSITPTIEIYPTLTPFLTFTSLVMPTFPPTISSGYSGSSSSGSSNTYIYQTVIVNQTVEVKETVLVNNIFIITQIVTPTYTNTLGPTFTNAPIINSPTLTSTLSPTPSPSQTALPTDTATPDPDPTETIDIASP